MKTLYQFVIAIAAVLLPIQTVMAQSTRSVIVNTNALLTTGFLPYAVSSTRVAPGPIARVDASTVAVSNQVLSATLTRGTTALSGPAATIDWDTSDRYTWTISAASTGTHVNVPTGGGTVQNVSLTVTSPGGLTIDFVFPVGVTTNWVSNFVRIPRAGQTEFGFSPRGTIMDIWAIPDAYATADGEVYRRASGTNGFGIISGSALWSSTGGLLVPSPSVNLVGITSQSGDSATNVVLILNSDVAWTTDNRRAISIRNNDVETAYHRIDGAVLIGKSVEAWWSPDNADFITGVKDASLGEGNTYNGYFAAVDDATVLNSWGDFQITGSSSPGGSSMFLTANDGVNGAAFNVAGTATGFSLKVLVNGSERFYVAPASGYTGAGTLFLSDDGTYKAAGGGDTIWTNVSGIIQPLSGQTTNTLSFTSGGSSDTNIAFLVNTANVLTNTLPILGLFQYTNANKLRIMKGGELVVGANTQASLGLQMGVALQSYNNPGLGDVDLQGVSLGVGDPGGFSAACDILGVTDGFAITLYKDANVVMDLRPDVTSGSGDPAYLFDTSLVLTNGDSIVEARNTGVTHFRVAGNSGYGGAGDRFLSDDGTYRTASSSSTITYTNQFVYNAKVTFNADTYVTNATIYIAGVDVRNVAYGLAASDETTALTTGTNKVRWRAPHAMTLTGVRASLTTAQTAGSILTIDVNKNGTTVLSTKLTIDQDETTSVTAATPPVISVSSFADDDIISVDVDQVGTSPAGLKITLLGLRIP